MPWWPYAGVVIIVIIIGITDTIDIAIAILVVIGNMISSLQRSRGPCGCGADNDAQRQR